MKIKTKLLCLFLGGCFSPLYIFGQGTVVMSNKGGVAVKNEGTIYVKGSTLMKGNQVSVLLDGKMVLDGSFYHDADGHVFKVDANGKTTSVGTLVFTGTTANRVVSTKANAIGTFDRTVNYIAFPNVSIKTNDQIAVADRMGMDAKAITLESGNTGKLLLKSGSYTDPDNAAKKVVYNASLRVTGAGNSSTVVTPGSVISELNLDPYRTGTGDVSTYPIFAFSAPMKGMRAGYFAGNFIRKMIADPTTGHVRFVMGNKDTDGNGIIDVEQYVRGASDLLENSSVTDGGAYLVKARPAGFNYDDLQMVNTNASTPSLYDKASFVFDGNIYGMASTTEQLYAEDKLFERTLATTPGSTVNWVIGNSWSSAIDVQKLKTYMTNHAMSFEPSIYVFPAGSTTYQRYSLQPGGSGYPAVQVISGLEAIPSMSVFMVRVLGTSPAGTFSITKDMQVHNDASHTQLRASSFVDEVLFRVSPENNENFYDLTAVGLRPDALVGSDDQDISKIFTSKEEVFQMYSLSNDDTKLSANVVPQGTPSVKLCFAPGKTQGRMKIKASRLESISEVYLEDLLTGEITDLKANDSYSFNTSAQDSPERFVVHFSRVSTGNDQLSNFLQCYYNPGQVVVKGLIEEDNGSVLSLYSVQGQLIKQVTVTQTGEMIVPVSLQQGVYVAKLAGKRNVTVKFVKGGAQ